MKSLKIIPLLLFISLLLFSCEKDNPEPEKSFSEKIIGRWEITEDVFSIFKSGHLPIASPNKLHSFLSKNKRFSQNEKVFIEFFENGDAVLGGVISFVGTYSISGKNSITIETVNSATYTPEGVIILKNLEALENTLSGLITISAQEKQFSANRAATITIDKKTQLLCREWKLDIPYLKEQLAQLPAELQEDVTIPDEMLWQFSKYGSTISTYIFDNEKDYDFNQWKWNDDKSFVMYEINQFYEFYSNPIQIVSLNEKELVIKQLWDEKDDAETHEIKHTYVNLRFIPVK